MLIRAVSLNACADKDVEWLGSTERHDTKQEANQNPQAERALSGRGRSIEHVMKGLSFREHLSAKSCAVEMKKMKSPGARKPHRKLGIESESRWGKSVQYLFQSCPGLLSRNIDNGWLRRVGWRQNGEEDEAFTERIISAMDLSLRHQQHFSRTQDAMFASDPLFGATGQDVDDLFARWMGVEWV